jgi:glutaminyl-peptide cyclotransferase
MKYHKAQTYILLLFALFLFSCGNETNQAPKAEKVRVIAPSFNADSAYLFIEQQVDFGPRFISSPGWNKCGNFLVQSFEKYTPHVKEQNAPITTYDGKSHTLRNIIASFSPEKNNRIALFAHWDTRHVADHDDIDPENPILGANDGGSGVGVLLEVARALYKQESNIGVDIILFDAEDYGNPESGPNSSLSWCIGSQHWSKNPHQQDYYARYGILLDMVGSENAVFAHEGYSRQYGNRILKKVWSSASKLGYDSYFQYKQSPAVLDDHYFVNAIANIPTIDIIEFDDNTLSGFNKHWHTHADDMRNINKETLKAVGQTLLEVIYNE